MSVTHRTDIKAKALRAAAKVALLGAGFGCGAAPTSGLQANATGTEDNQAPDAGEAAADASAPVDAGVVVVGDAGVLDSGLPLDSGAIPDAGEDFCDIQTLSPDDYLACCERIGWDWDKGCAAWGPPAPPALKKELA